MQSQSNKNIKIAFFHLAYLYSGGGEKLALKEISFLKSQGYQVDCFASLVDINECFPDIIKKHNIKEIFPNFTKIFRNKPEIGIILTCLLFPFIALNYKKYDLVFGANQPSPYFGLILKLFFKTPYITYLAQPTRIIYPRPIDKKQGLIIKNKLKLLPHIINIFRPLFFWIDLKSITYSDTFLCNGEYMQDILSQIYGKTPTVCSAGASTKSYKLAFQSNKLINFRFRNILISQPFLFVSNRHFPHKKLEHAFDVLDKMQLKMPLLISGEPTTYTDKLKELVTFYKLNNYIHFLGYVTEKELDRLYKHCFVYLYTAPEEDFGMGIIEAMGYSKPVIAWDNAGPSKIIHNKIDGFLVKNEDTAQMSQIIEQLQKDYLLYSQISNNAHNSIIEKYSWKNHFSILEQNIQKITQSHSKVEIPTINRNPNLLDTIN
ncbi:MAG: glycosyltransferase [bacterium]|nr:glycosyltransferase [bacterium]